AIESLFYKKSSQNPAEVKKAAGSPVRRLQPHVFGELWGTSRLESLRYEDMDTEFPPLKELTTLLSVLPRKNGPALQMAGAVIALLQTFPLVNMPRTGPSHLVAEAGILSTLPDLEPSTVLKALEDAWGPWREFPPMQAAVSLDLEYADFERMIKDRLHDIMQGQDEHFVELDTMLDELEEKLEGGRITSDMRKDLASLKVNTENLHRIVKTLLEEQMAE
ncbi:hypothetical protein EIP91_011209, partial [Steccherinum ochraceum]